MVYVQQAMNLAIKVYIPHDSSIRDEVEILYIPEMP